MHPQVAARLVRAVSAEGDTVLDPFCGSGTVLVEALIAGRHAVGVDLNPLAVHLARLKTQRFPPRALEGIMDGARKVAAFSKSRRERRAGATQRFPAEDVALFEPHVLLELDSLRAGIARQSGLDARGRAALELVLSAILIKVSRQSSDTSAARAPRRLAAGFTTRFFERKAEELAHRLADFAGRLPAGAPPARVELDDASHLRTIGASTIDAVVTSPPYVSTYDYFAHHEARLRWLDLDAGFLAAGEMGSRRRYASLDAKSARKSWLRELGASFGSLARVCRPGARVLVLAGDSAVRNEVLRADLMVTKVAREAGFSLIASASQTRPDFHAQSARAFSRHGKARAEHALAFEKSHVAALDTRKGGQPHD